jgi:hypothetical protein
MTTPEQEIKQWAREAGWVIRSEFHYEGESNVQFMLINRLNKFAELARADLVAENEALIDLLKTSQSNLNDLTDMKNAEINALNIELEAAKADAARYRFIYEKSCQVGIPDETLVFYIRNQSKLDDRIADATIAAMEAPK